MISNGWEQPWAALALLAGVIVFVVAVAWSFRVGRRCEMPRCRNDAEWVNDYGIRVCDHHVPPEGGSWKRLDRRIQ